MEIRDTLLLVDDAGSNRSHLRTIFEESYNLLEAENGVQAMLLLEQNHRCIAAVLLDIVMPLKDGYQVLEEMGERGFLPKIPVIIITSEGSSERHMRAFDLGAAEIITKPYSQPLVRHRVQNIVDLYSHKWHLEELVEEQSLALRHSHEAVVDTLSSIIEHRSAESGQHILRIRRFTQILLEAIAASCPEYRLDQRAITLISSAAALHDIGKISIPDAILNKPGKLTAEEFQVMKTHSVTGCQMLEGLESIGDATYLRYAHNICRYHHERWDGRGYPDGLEGDEIPICAQVVGLADAYDALTTKRAYKPSFTSDRAMNMILNGECGAFSPQLLECFKQVSGRFAALAASYADGASPKAETFSLEPPGPERREGLDALNAVQMKYHTLLHYIDATVVEVDLDLGIYHLVYNPDPDMALLKSDSTFHGCVHFWFNRFSPPEERERLLRRFYDNLDRFLDEGLRKQAFRYQAQSPAGGGEELAYEVTFLRMDPSDMKRPRLITIWRRAGTARPGPGFQVLDGGSAGVYSLLAGLYCCRNDKRFTLDSSSTSISGLLGYTNAELQAKFQNHLIELALPEDRAMIRRRISEQLTHGPAVELECRLRHRDGHVIWALNKSRLAVRPDGTEYLYGVLMDITQTKSAQEDLNLALQRHQIILNQSDDVIFEWDIQADALTVSPKWETLFGYPAISNEMSIRISKSSHFHPEDIPLFQKAMRALRRGEGYQEMEVRIAKADGRYLWCRIRATAQYREDGAPIRAVGVIVNIDAEKRATQALQARAERDALTKLLNKNASRLQAEQHLLSRGKGDLSALLIIDLDNFKQVNDRYGHMFGDAVLSQAAAEIRRLFRAEDIIARIGGDEFLVFLKSIPDRALVEQRCVRLLEVFGGMFRERLADCPLSCSVGVALAPEHGTAYQELFQRADQALYRAKAQGKNRYLFYQTGDPDLLSASTTATTINERIDSDEQPGLADSSLVHYAFQRLYESGDVEGTVQSILELVGSQMNVSRAYIFENSPDNKTCSNTFEWCNDGVSPEIGNLQGISYETDIPGYESNFDERGLFYCPDVSTLPRAQYDILAPQGIKSMLQCAIRDQGAFRGYVGFDECSANRLWTQEQIDALTFLSQILSVFLLKQRAQDNILHRAEELRLLLDSQDSWVYVIDPDTCRLKFLNAKTRSLVPSVKEGMPCYQALMGMEFRCPGCPALGIREKRHNGRIVDNLHLGLRVHSQASLVHWRGEEACLITCHELAPLEEHS